MTRDEFFKLSDSDRAAVMARADRAVEQGLGARTCAHHRTYPDSDNYCMGEPSHYCETNLSAYLRAGGA